MKEVNAGKEEKTNAIRTLEQKKIPFTTHNYVGSGAVGGMEIVEVLGEDPDRVYKTLVTVGKTNQHYVFLVPVNRELDLKKAAKAVGEKYVEMVKSRELLELTGYIHGGCSPIGMKKVFRTTVDESARNFDTVYFSGGRIGFQIETAPENLEKVVRLTYADLTEE